MESKRERACIFKRVEYLTEAGPVTIRPARKEDLAALTGLDAESFSVPWSEKSYAQELDRGECLYVTALFNEEPVGCCGVAAACGDGDITKVAVSQKLRRLGIGKQMLLALMQWGGELGIINYTLEVRVSNEAAVRLYESLGFKKAGIRPGYYDKPREDALIMWKRQEEDGQITMPVR